MDILTPCFTFLFILSVVILTRFIIRLGSSMMSNPPKPYEFDKQEPLVYMVIFSYILTFLIYII